MSGVWVITPEENEDWWDCLTYGYFTSQQAAEDFLRGVNEPLRQRYEAYVAEIEAMNRLREAEDSLREQSNVLLRANGLPEIQGWKKQLLTIETYEQWSKSQTRGLETIELKEAGE